MLITLILLQVLILLVLGYIAYKMPKRVEVMSAFVFGDDVSLERAEQSIEKHVAGTCTIGDVASMRQLREAMHRGHQVPPGRLPPSPESVL